MTETLQCDALWRNVRLATLCADSPEARYGERPGAALGAASDALAIKDGRIVWLGAAADLPTQLHAAQHFDGGARWVTPGLIDCHTHLVHGGNRAREFEMRLEGHSYEAIARAGGGILSTLRETRQASEDALYDSALRRLTPLLQEGVTAIEIKSGYGLDLPSETKLLRVARRFAALPLTVRTTFLGAHAVPPEFAGRADAYLDYLIDTMLPALAKAGLVDAVDVFCETIGFTPEQTERVFRAAQAHGLPVKIHAEQLSNQSGAALAARYQALSADHLEYLDEAGVIEMARHGTVAVLLPGAYYFLRETRLPPLDLLRKHGVPIALATDNNPGTSPVTSLLLMLNMACTLFRMTPAEALAGVTRHAAAALGLHDAGTLAVGRRADFVLWDIEHPAELSYAIGANPCHQVFVAGHLRITPPAPPRPLGAA